MRISRLILFSLLLMLAGVSQTLMSAPQTEELSGPYFSEKMLPEGEETLLPSLDYDIYPDSLAEFFDYATSDNILRLAVVLSDIYSKKDMEFSRGLLLGMSQAGLPEGSLSLKIINGEISEDSLQYELDLFGPHVIMSTFEKDAPTTLRSYSQQNPTYLLNIFDSKGDDYIYNDRIFQIISPSDKFNPTVSAYIIENFADNVLVLVGDPDPSDSAIRELILSWPEENLMIFSLEDLPHYTLDEEVNYLIYPLFSSNDDIKETLARTVEWMAQTPSAGVRVFGRPSWIAINDLNTAIANMEVYIPEKCYFDPSSERGKRFISAYNAAYGHAPIRSYPVYAVMGYDTSRYFLPRLLEAVKGEEAQWEPENMDQSYFNLKKSDFGGYYNRGAFILHYEPWGTMTKELLD